MNINNKIFNEIKTCTNPSSIVNEYENESDHVARFTNIFAFMDRCKSRNVTPENSITFYTNGYMYIKFPFIRCI